MSRRVQKRPQIRIVGRVSLMATGNRLCRPRVTGGTIARPEADVFWMGDYVFWMGDRVYEEN